MFEEILIESTRKTQKTVGGLSLPLSIALHALIIGATVAASLWFVEDSADPSVPIVFYPPGSPPPLGSARTPSNESRAPRRSAFASKPIPVVSGVPSRSDLREVPTAQASEVGNEDLGRGDPEGVIGGTGQQKDGKADADDHVETALRPGGDVRPPQLVVRIEPEYPEIERKLRKEGIVILEAIITTEGRVDEVRVLKSADPILDEAARRAVMQWRYKPAILNGRAVRVYLTATVTFHLH